MELRDRSLTEFTELIASTAPAPGGGGASALVASVAVSLGDMVGELTVGKKKYADVEDDIKALMKRAQELRVRLLELIDKDAEDFKPLAAAYAIPKDDPTRDEVMEKCLRLAAGTPLEIFDICCEVIDIQKGFADKGSRLMISDAATGAAFALGAMKGAAVNVKVNTKLMKNREYATGINEHIDSKMAVSEKIAEEVFNDIYRKFDYE